MTKDIQHGTTTTYSHHKCRCSECRAAVAEYSRKRQQAKRDGTWVPGRAIVEKVQCTGPECDRPARHKTPQPLCESHYQQIHVRGVALSPIKRRKPVVDGKKECTRCGELLPVTEFSQKLSGMQPACKACVSIINRVNRYGVPFDVMAEIVRQPCAGCGATAADRPLHVDHCHNSGRVRGMLCHNCNTVLTVHMTPEILRALADYLEAAVI